jgi:hypothetical protein
MENESSREKVQKLLVLTSVTRNRDIIIENHSKVNLMECKAHLTNPQNSVIMVTVSSQKESLLV